MFEIAILYVISVLVSGCNQKKSKVKDVVRDTDNKEVKNIEEIKKRFKLKDVKDLIFIPIKKNRCIVWNNYYYRHAVFSNSPRLMLGPVNESIQEVGGPFVSRSWFEAYTDLEDNLIPIRYGKNHDVCFHHDSNPKTKKINELSMLVYLEDIDEGYFILEKSKECGKVYVDLESKLEEARVEILPFPVEFDQRFVDPDTEYVECGGKFINIKKKNYCITKLELGSDFKKNIKKIKKSFDDETKWSEDRLAATHLPRLGKIEEISPNNKEECNNAHVSTHETLYGLDVGWEGRGINEREDSANNYARGHYTVGIREKRESIMLDPDYLKNIGKWSKRPNNNFVYLYEDKDNKITKKLKGKLDNCDITFT